MTPVEEREKKKSNRANHFPSRSPWKVSRTVYAQRRRLPAPGVNARSSSFKAATFDFLDYSPFRDTVGFKCPRKSLFVNINPQIVSLDHG